jgi:hypothetical protein
MAERKRQCKREGSSGTNVASEDDERDSSPELDGGSGGDRITSMSVPIGQRPEL